MLASSSSALALSSFSPQIVFHRNVTWEPLHVDGISDFSIFVIHWYSNDPTHYRVGKQQRHAVRKIGISRCSS